MSATPCPVCNGDLKLVAPLTNGYSYYRCADCTLITSLPVPTPEDIAAFYDGFLFGKPADEEERRAGISEDVGRIRKDIERFGNTAFPLSILDWGGGTGFYSNAFADLGCRVTMVDIDPQACQYAAEHFGGKFKIINGDPTTCPLDDLFDVVFCTHVIEHCADLHGLMRRARAVLAPNGLLILATPNQGCKEFWFRRSWMSHYVKRTARKAWDLPRSLIQFLRTPWICCDPPRHLHAFNRTSLTRLVQIDGFEVATCFGECITSQYYCRRVKFVWRVHRVRSLARIAIQVPDYLGIQALRLLAPDGAYGSNLVLYARPR